MIRGGDGTKIPPLMLLTVSSFGEGLCPVPMCTRRRLLFREALRVRERAELQRMWSLDLFGIRPTRAPSGYPQLI